MENLLLSPSMLRDELLCSNKYASGKCLCDNRSINYYDKSVNRNQTTLGQNQYTENSLSTLASMLKEIHDSLTRNDDFLEIVNKNADTNFDDMLLNNVHCDTTTESNSGLYDAVVYLMYGKVKEFINECFIKDIILVKILFIMTFMMKIVQLTTRPSTIITQRCIHK